MLPLPDRHALLDLLDHEARGVERVAAVRMGRRDRDAHVSKRERAHAMLDDDLRASEPVGRFGRDLHELALGHRLVRGVLHPRHRAAVVHVAHGAEEERRRAVGAGRHLRDERGRVDRACDDGGARHPPATGGMSATSSPARMISPGEAYSWLSAISGAGGSECLVVISLTFVSNSFTVAPSGIVTAMLGAPNASA